MHHIDVVNTDQPNLLECEFVFNLRNKEYPSTISFKNKYEAHSYISSLKKARHLFLKKHDRLIGWAYTALRDGETWFAIIVSSEFQGSGLGSLLLTELKKINEELYGWVVEDNIYIKGDGNVYKSPLAFYLKNGFTKDNVTNETPILKTTRISWKKTEGKLIFDHNNVV